MTLDVLAVSGGRADWGLLRPVLTALTEHPAFSLRIAATGQHADTSQSSLAEIGTAGFSVEHTVEIGMVGGSVESVTRSMGRAIIEFAELFAASPPNLLLVLGDRYEIHGAVTAALLARIPVAHLCGGDVTEGAVDDALRHGITKMSHLHFVTNGDAKTRVAQLGENPAQVYNVGSPGIDQIIQIPRISRPELFSDLGLSEHERNVLVCYHPVTLRSDSLAQCQEMLAALQTLNDTGIILTGSNADPGGKDIDEALRTFADANEDAIFVQTLGSKRFLSALAAVNVVVGNSSSGLYEAPTLQTPTVNIGDRQKGRLRATSVVDCAPMRNDIAIGIAQALTLNMANVVSPYGDGHAAQKIVDILAPYAHSPQTLVDLVTCKRFIDIDR